jgi:hypothetical protein
MALKVERVLDRGIHAEDALGGLSRFEPLHLALSSSHRLMRILRSIISPEPLVVRAGQSQAAKRRGVGAQLAFCRAHNTRTTSDPHGSVEISAKGWSLVEPYRFGSGTSFAGVAVCISARCTR